MRGLVWVALVAMAVPLAGAQPGVEDAITDGVPFELDDAATVAALGEFGGMLSGQNIHDCVDEMTKDFPSSYRVMGTPTQDIFVDKYATVFANLGLKSGLQHFDRGAVIGAGAVLGEGGTNIIGVLPGTDTQRWIVVGGHYDTRELTVGGGALDNASGACSVLELARAAKEYTDEHGPLEASLVFVWYDGEEWGLYGAIAFADDLNFTKDLLEVPRDAPVDVMVSQSFDMPGINWPARNIWPQYDDGGDEQLAVLNLRTAPIHVEEEWRCWSYGCYEELKQHPEFDAILRRNINYQFLVREVAHDYLEGPPGFVWVYDDNYGRSDHIPLIARGAAGMRIQGSHDEEYPCYHQPCDTLEWLYVQTGSKEELLAAYDMEIKSGGLVAFYVALTGGVGAYGDLLWGVDSTQSVDGSVDEGKRAPSPAWVGLLALGGALWARRKG